MDRADLIVVGAGAAGLYAALCAAREGARVALISARPLADTASYWAQGGLAAALAPDDSPELHLEDTIAAGRGIVRASAARILVEEATSTAAPSCPASTRSARPPAPASTAPTGSPRTRSRSASCSAGAPRRAGSGSRSPPLKAPPSPPRSNHRPERPARPSGAAPGWSATR